GTGAGHTLQMSYGVIDRLDWYWETTFYRQNISIDPVLAEVDDEGNHLSPAIAPILGVEDTQGYGAEEFLYDTFPALGRPTPQTTFTARRLMGDINTGFSWNYFRNSRMSGALTPRIFIPSGWQPEPEQDILYGTGPALEVNGQGWATSTTHGLDFRLFRSAPWFDVIASTETTIAYGFNQNREFPTNFVAPLEVAQQLDPEAFPDMSGLSGTFDYIPGWSFDWLAQINFQLALFGVGFGYGVQHSSAPTIRIDESDPAQVGFVQMIDSLELIGSSTANLIQVGGSVSLLPIYLPMNVAFSYKRYVGGHDVIALDNWIQVTLEAVAPVFMLWNRDPFGVRPDAVTMNEDGELVFAT
ncbi:MAG: hypothetical protein KDA28_05135, partial [Phycisphaerales bacterium]|nr:hypothetical protein [Phycisphaerales bacterium]